MPSKILNIRQRKSHNISPEEGGKIASLTIVCYSNLNTEQLSTTVYCGCVLCKRAIALHQI